VGKFSDRLAQYRFIADHAIDACRLQHQRVTSGAGVGRHDMDFYVLALSRLHELTRMIRERTPDPTSSAARAAYAEFDQAIPALLSLRDWWVHPPEPGVLGFVSWFPSDIVRLQPRGGVEYLVDAETAQPAAEQLYEALVAMLPAS
jgi:hypothetical protein